MRCNPPCLCRGWPDALLLHTDKGGGQRTQGAKQMVHLPMPELPPSALAGDRATSRHGRWTGSVCVPELPPPSEDGASKLKSTRTQFQAAAKAKQRHRRARPNSHAPTVSGTSELQGDVHNCPKAAAPKRNEGWGDATGVMDDTSIQALLEM